MRTSVSASPGARRVWLKSRLAMGIVTILLWLAYTAIYTFPASEATAALIQFIPGILGIAIVIMAGLKREDCYLRAAQISRSGAAVLAAASVIFIPILATGRFTGWNWLSGLVYAPASGIAQELFFRATLLPAFMAIFKGKRWLALSLHSLLFALWHVPVAFMEAPLAGAMAVTVVTFLAGIAWGWQVQRDRTVVWAMAHHVLGLVIMSLFTWG
ncbi:MAG: CPBP family intramembrane glutamic endopeptidase [Bacillota bacterium]